ncbi:hypothetical protein A5695_20395 [Mycobacterium sp. E1747]|nr:hypothetical protein A5695_20395 [Mycobacterium sp. E1747]
MVAPELDLGWWLGTFRLFSDAIDIPLPQGFPTRCELVSRYEELTGFTVAHLRHPAAGRSHRCRRADWRLAILHR